MSGDTFGNLSLLLGSALSLSLFVVFLASLVWLNLDAQRSGKTGCLWLLIAFFTRPFGVIAYLLLRDREVIL